MRIVWIVSFVAAALAVPGIAPARTTLLPDPPPSSLAVSPGILDRSPLGDAPALELPFSVAPAAEALLAQRAIREKEEDRKSEERAAQAKPKSPGKALLFSAAVPGTGQLYNGSKRGFVYLGVEALSWFAYFSFHSSGEDKQHEYQDYADGHWDIDRLKAAASDTNCVTPPDSLDIARIEEFRETNEQHYYEDVGKLEAYSCGWDSPTNRQTYRDMRKESNRLLTNARRATTVAFINHVVSAVDAFLLARKFNKHLGQGIDMKLELVADVRNPRGKVTLTKRFF